MKYTVHIGNTPIVLEHENLPSNIDIDAMTTVDTSNLFGEAVTVSAAANRIGVMKAEIESQLAIAKLDLKIYEGKFRAKLRKEAAENGNYFTLRVDNSDVKVKATEKALETAFETEKQWIELKKVYIKKERDLNALDSLYWSIQNKSRTINNIVGGTTPEEFVSELVEGRINGILISKKKK